MSASVVCLLLLIAGVATGQPFKNAQRLTMTDKESVLDDAHLWIHSGDIAVHPGLRDVGGVDGFFSPPIAGRNTTISLLLDGKVVKTDSYEWSLGEITRRAQMGDVEISTRLIAMKPGGFLLTVTFGNRGAKSVHHNLSWRVAVSIDVVKSQDWGWVPPGSGTPVSARQSPAGAHVFSTPSVDGHSASIAVATSSSLVPNPDSGGFEETLVLEPGSNASLSLALAAGIGDGIEARVDQMVGNVDAVAKGASAANSKWLADVLSAFPRLESSSRELEAFYHRGLVSYASCLWESGAFLLKPHIAESGIDGGAVCTYPWGIAYVAKILATSQPEVLKAHIVQTLRSNPFEHYAFTPLDGSPIGPWYSYNQFSIVWMVWQYVLHTGDKGFLNENVYGRSVYQWAYENALYRDDLSRPVALIDYGKNHNLLELKKTNAYEHFVPSPNAERCWSFRAVDQMAKLLGLPSPGLSTRADELAAVIREKLWRDGLGWFVALDANGSPLTSWSIQVFDMLRFGVPTADQQRALLAHLSDSEFLSAQGVHSLSKKDPGYDIGDVDWGGPGVYAGDAPELIEDLYRVGEYALGDTLLKRILWWGTRLPYYPQAIRADAIDYRRDGRANVVAGLKASEMAVFGLLGLRVEPSGAFSVRPHLPEFVDDYRIDNIRIGKRTLSVAVEGDAFTVSAKGVRTRTAKIGSCVRID